MHAATISSITIPKDASGKKLVNKETGEEYISIVFTGSGDMTGQVIIDHNDTTQYQADKLIQACRLNNQKEPVHVKELIGKRIWIYVKGTYRIGQHPGIDPPEVTEVIPGKYSQFFGPKPANIDDPDFNGGIPRGIFVEFADIPLISDPVNLEEREFGDD